MKAIFNNNFKELRIFSFDCGEGINANNLLWQRKIAENLICVTFLVIQDINSQ